MRRIWFKPDCIKWIRDGKKTTTFRLKRYEGDYEIVEGSRFKPESSGLIIKLTPIMENQFKSVVWDDYSTEGPFIDPEEFGHWLQKNGLWRKYFNTVGWLHEIEVLEGGSK